MVATKTKLPSIQKSVVEQVIQLLTTLPDRTNSSEEISKYADSKVRVPN